MVAYELCYSSRLCDIYWLRLSLWDDGDDGRFAQCMDLLQCGWRKLAPLVAVIYLDVIRSMKSFEKPKNALRAGLLEPETLATEVVPVGMH